MIMKNKFELAQRISQFNKSRRRIEIRQIYSVLVPLIFAVLMIPGTNKVLAEEAKIAISSSIPSTSEKVVYTIEGKKDPRLQATFLATYISTSKSDACSDLNPTTATRKVKIGSKRYPITDEHYRIEIPIYLEENENQCGYRFSRIELMLRRLYDEELYSRHILLDKVPKVEPIYYGHRTGISGGGESPLLMPGTLYTDKTYFSIAKQTQYICRTKWYQWLNDISFYCFMRIRDGKGKNQFVQPNHLSIVTHPEFGTTEIRSETLQVNIFADDSGSKA